MDEFNDKVAVVTGGASGIGRGICTALAGVGTHVVVADIDAEKAEKLAEELRGKGVRSIAVATDVAQTASVAALAERLTSASAARALSSAAWQ